MTKNGLELLKIASKLPKMTNILALAAAQIPEIYFDAHIQNAEQLKTELFTEEGRFMIDTIRNGILGGGVTKDIIDTLEMVCDKCSNYEPKLSDVQNMLLFPDLSEDGESKGRVRVRVIFWVGLGSRVDNEAGFTGQI